MLIFLIALVVILATFFFKNSYRPKNYPPGPLCLPIIGSWYSVPGVGVEKKIEKWRKKYGNIIGHKMGSKNLVFIAGYEETVSALKNKNFQNRMHLSTLTHRTFYKVLGLFFSEGEQYTEIHRFTVRFLNQVSAATLESLVHHEMMNFFSTIKSGDMVQVDGEFAIVAVNVFLTYLMGDSLKSARNEAKTLREFVYRYFRHGRPSGIENFYPWMGIFFQRKHHYASAEHVQHFFKNRIEEHKESFNPEKIRDYIDAFLLEQEKEKQTSQNKFYTDEELIACLLDMGQAAGETTNNTIAFILLYVALHPQVQMELHKELDKVLGNRFPVLEDKSSLPYCQAVIEETMRVNTIAATSVQHVAAEDTEFHGYTIPRGTYIIFPLWAMFRNPDDYDDPSSFKPERFMSKDVKSKVLNFGLGKRVCIAESIARKTMLLFVSSFFQKYSISLPKGYKRPDTEAILGFTNCPKPFDLVITERQSK